MLYGLTFFLRREMQCTPFSLLEVLKKTLWQKSCFSHTWGYNITVNFCSDSMSPWTYNGFKLKKKCSFTSSSKGKMMGHVCPSSFVLHLYIQILIRTSSCRSGAKVADIANGEGTI